MALLNFDARQVAPATGFDPVPPGWYNVIVDESDMKPTKDGTGSYLKVRYSILDGQYANRKIYTMINLQNKNPQASEIGMKQLSALAHAVGHLLVQQSEELHGKPLKVKVKIRPADGDYEAQNSVTQWENINAAVGDAAVAPIGGAPAFAGAAPGAFPAQAQPAPAAAGMPAWGAAPAAAAQPAPQAQPAATGWAPPAGAQQPWAGQAAPAAQAAPTQAAPVQQTPPAGGFNPNSSVPPWAQR